jgi:transformer-2 protein
MSRSRSHSHDQDVNAGDTSPGTNLYIANLSYSTTDQELQDFFGAHGKVSACRIIRDPTDNTSRGFGFVTFESAEDAEKVVTTMTTCELGGRSIRIEKARRGRPYNPTPGRYLGPSQRRVHDDHDRRNRSRSPRRRSNSSSRYRRSPRRSRSPKRSPVQRRNGSPRR